MNIVLKIFKMVFESGLTDNDYTIFLCVILGFVLYFICSKIKNFNCKGGHEVSTDEDAAVTFDNLEGGQKMVLVIRNDLKIGKGKSAAQCSHAAVMAYEMAGIKNPQILKKWKKNGQRKIVVKVENERELLKVADDAKKAGLIYAIVKDAGLTQIERGTLTVVAVGPGNSNLIDEVTGHLKLY